MSEDVAVYRRRKTSRCENSETRQRVIGGIGRRKNTSNNAIQSRIQQFAQTEDQKDGVVAEVKDENSLLPPQNQQHGKVVSRSNSGSSSDFHSWKNGTGVERSNSMSSNSSGTSSKNNSSAEKQTYVGAHTKYGAINTPGRSRRVSVATTTGRDHAQNLTQKNRSESTSALGQGSLLRSKQMKWETLSNENDKNNYENSMTPSLYRNRLNDESGKTKPFIRENSSQANEKSSDENSRTPSLFRRKFNDKEAKDKAQSPLEAENQDEESSQTPSLYRRKFSDRIEKDNPQSTENIYLEPTDKLSEDKPHIPSLYRRKFIDNDTMNKKKSSLLENSSLDKNKEQKFEEKLGSFKVNEPVDENKTSKTESKFKSPSNHVPNLNDLDNTNNLTKLSSSFGKGSIPSVGNGHVTVKTKDDSEYETNNVKSEVVRVNFRKNDSKTFNDENSAPYVTNTTTKIITTATKAATITTKATTSDYNPDPSATKAPTKRAKKPVVARKLSTSIAAIQSQLETNFDNSSKPSKVAPGLRLPLSSHQQNEQQATTNVSKIKTRLCDVNNNNESSDIEEKRTTKKRSSDSFSSDKSTDVACNNAINQIKSQDPTLTKKTSSATDSSDNLISSSHIGISSCRKRDTSLSSIDGKSLNDTSSENEKVANKRLLSKSKTKITLTKTDNDKLLHTQDHNKKICNKSYSPVSSKQNLLSKTTLKSGYKTSTTVQSVKESEIVDNIDEEIGENLEKLKEEPLQKSTEKVIESENKLNNRERKKISYDRLSGDTTNCTGVQCIEYNLHAERDLTDQKELSQQKTQVDIFSTSSESSLHRQKVAYVNENTNFVFETNSNAGDNIYVNETNTDAIIENNNYAKFEKISQRLSARGRSSTWTTSDSEEILDSELSPEGKDKVVLGSSSDNITEGKDTPGRRRRLTKKRSKKSKVRPKINLRNNSQNRSFDTSDGDILESNYTSDDFSASKSRELSSTAESTICESDINDNYEELNVSTTNKSVNFQTLNDYTESKSINNQTKDIIDESIIVNNTEILLAQIEGEDTIYKNSNQIKSESMTTITKHQQESLISLSTSNMGGSRSDDEGLKLSALHKTKDDRIGSLSSITTVSTKVIQSFNSSSYSSPPFKKRANSAENQQYHSISFSEISNSHNNNNNSIKASPFSLAGLEKHSDTEYERTARSEKLESLKQDFPLNSTFMKKTYSLNNSQVPDEESKKNAEVLDSLPHYPFYLSERFTRDTQIMQSRSTGSLGKMLSDSPQIVREIDIDGDSEIISTTSPFTLKKPETHINNLDISNDNDDEFIAPPDSFKDVGTPTSKHFKTHPPLNMSPKPLQINNDKKEPIKEDAYLALRRPSYLKAREESEGGIGEVYIPKVPPPPNSETESADVKVIKRPGLPKLPTTMKINDSKKTNADEAERVVTPPSPEKSYQENDSEDDVDPNFKDKVEQVENKRSRQRLLLAQPPQLSGIPEVPHLYGKREKRKEPKYGFPEETIPEEAPCKSPVKPEQDVDDISQGSDLRSTPRDLSMEDLSSDTDAKEEETAVISSTVNNKKLFSSATSLTESVRSMSSITSVNVTNPDDNVTIDGMTIPRINTPEGESKPTSSAGKKPKPDMRRHVLQNLLDTEKSYVTNLGAMLTMFFHPLKHPENVHIIEPALLDEIFYQIPEILESHEHFLDEVTSRVDEWSDEQIIGDIFSTSFTKHKLMDAYSNFINNFVQASDAIRQASSRPQFTKYLEQCTKLHKEKLTLNDLLITPVQRIPRYELILKDMLKHTGESHPDYTYLKDALREIRKLAEKMNKGEAEAKQSEKDIDKLRDIEQNIEGITDLVSGTRKFIRQDLVAENKGTLTKKDRCLFLFSNLLVCTSVRRKNHVLRRNSLFTGQSAAEFNRYKFLWKLPLEDIEVCKASNSQQNGGSKEIERLEEDVKTLENMLNLSDAISVSHQNVESALRELLMDVKSMVQEKQSQSPQTTLSPLLSKIELQSTTDEAENYTFIFLSAECKSSWEAYFNDAKQKLAYSRDTFPPEFQYATPINKTRSGMQFTCASPSFITGFGECANDVTTASGEVWVCNSDGYVGQVCLLSMTPKVQSKASLSVCSARIVCIAVVPGARLVSDRNTANGDILKMADTLKKSKSFKHKKSVPSDMSDDDDNYGTGAETIIAFDSSGDEDEPMSNSYMGGAVNPFSSGRISPDSSSLGANESMDGDRVSSEDDYSSDDENRSNLPNDNGDLENDLDSRACMWLGTEDGHIFIYNTHDAITQRKSKAKLQMSSPVTSLLYFENKVFVALCGGELCIYKRDMTTGEWDLSSSENIRVSITGAKISCMTAVAGRIWCGCDNTIALVNATSLKLEPTILVSDDSNRIVNKIVSYGLGVWVSSQGSATVRLYHATTYENLLDVDVTNAVQKMLAGADAIIRQHKAACLRVTSLLICKDLLWIGTSAGVILTNPLPSITASTSVLKNIGPTGSPHGHTGHVRFLTSIEVPKGMFRFVDGDHSNHTSPSPSSNRIQRKDSEKLRDLETNGEVTGTDTLVVSGGDGYEDFRNNQQNEAVGRDDSTNHLLLWRV